MRSLVWLDQVSKRRLEQAEATINDFLANPVGGMSDESAKDAKIKELK